VTKLISLIAIGCIAIACNQNKKSKDINLNTSIDAVNNKVSLTTDTTNIDVVKVSPDNYKILLENEYVRIVEYTLKPGEKDNLHSHPAKTEYVV
jgi:predicted component of type VI protein secretion system